MVSAAERTPGTGPEEAAGGGQGTVWPELWHVLQISDVLDLEFATGLAEGGPVLLWEPRRSFLPRWPGLDGGYTATEHPHLQIAQFPVLRGLAPLPFSLLKRRGPALLKRLLARTPVPARSVLVCTTP